VEQRFNAFYIERLGYGMQADMFRLQPALLAAFESRLEEFTGNVGKGSFYGNEQVFSLVTNFIRTGSL
jgi:hypothetical protein